MMGTCPLMLMRPSACVPAPDQSIARFGRRSSIDGGRHVIVTDEPVQLGGGDTAPAPHELFPAALASCISTTIAMYAHSRGWEIGDVRVDVDYDHRSTPRRFAIELHLDPSLPEDRVTRLAKVAASCPVRRAIESGIVFDERVVLDQPPLVAGLSSDPARRVDNADGKPRSVAR